MYQLAYKQFLEDHHISVVRNCFLMPTENAEIVKAGCARMNMLAGLSDLVDIQIRLIPADNLFNCYLSRKSIDIQNLEL